MQPRYAILAALALLGLALAFVHRSGPERRLEARLADLQERGFLTDAAARRPALDELGERVAG